MQFDPESLYFVPLGGSGQFGVNFNVYAYGGKFLAVDLGMGFADDRLPGIDIVLPDLSFLEDAHTDLVALVLTHAHEDHIGALTYLWPRLRCPVYCSRYTASVLRHKLKEAGLTGQVKLRILDPAAPPVEIAPFRVSCLHVAHSIPDSLSVCIETPLGRVLHSGDWNLDPAPVLGTPTDSEGFRKLGAAGVLAYVGDSTNAGIPGRAGSESEVEKGLAEVFRNHDGRIAVTMFASNIQRIRSISRAAQTCGRHVGLVGRSLHTMSGAARECGFLDDIPEFLSESDLAKIPHSRQVLIVTGSQGEYRAALARIARGDHAKITFDRGDTVIFSARPIPGNEKEIDSVKNNLSAAGVTLITSQDSAHTIHVSGHPCAEEILEMLDWVRPQIVIPVHGERHQMEAQATLARSAQVPQVLVPENGKVICLAKAGETIQAHVAGEVRTGIMAVESNNRLIESNHPSITARRKLQFTGAAHISLVMDGRGDLVADPEISTYGLCDPSQDDLEPELRTEILEILEDMTLSDLEDNAFVREEIRIGVRRFCAHTLGLKPKVSVHLTRV